MKRTLGLSALVRLRNEEVWCRLALESIVKWCDEIIVTLNCCDDRTPGIVRQFAAEYRRKVKFYEYPHEIWPMGPGHDRIKSDDPRSSAAYYNFTQAQSTRTHVVKWDGDMVAMDWLGDAIRSAMAAGHDRVRFSGIDIVGDDLKHIGCHPVSRTNGVYKVTAETWYKQGPMTQNLQGIAGIPEHEIKKPGFLHFKWARKSFESATVQWPKNWQEIPHFQRIAERRKPVAPYTGEYPASVRAML